MNAQSSYEYFCLHVDLVRVINENFLDVDLNDPRFKEIKIVLITANCTRSGVPDPVNFIIREGEGQRVTVLLAYDLNVFLVGMYVLDNH